MDGYDDIPPSPLKNFIGGGGCGCGCFGLLAVGGAGLTFGMIAYQYFPLEYNSMIGTVAGVGALVGILLTILGSLMWTASLFLD